MRVEECIASVHLQQGLVEDGRIDHLHDRHGQVVHPGGDVVLHHV